ncbi:hypothetical protein FRC07_008035 [Ceratobasidium sp. 392]|nr:hypothetical protein FRC07_008035 [Ceratobasidium sp. 392]
MAVVEMAHKYGMPGIKADFQNRLLDELPTSANTALSMPDSFNGYRDNSWLTREILEYGHSDHKPWALYALGVQLTLDLDPSNTSTYSVPSPLSQQVYAYSYYHALFTAREVIVQSLEDWNDRLEAFFRKGCDQKGATPVAAYSTRANNNCTRLDFKYEKSPLYISPKDKCKDPVREMVKCIKELEKQLSMHGEGYCTWCTFCTNALKSTAEGVINDLHSRLVECVGLTYKQPVAVSD